MQKRKYRKLRLKPDNAFGKFNMIAGYRRGNNTLLLVENNVTGISNIPRTVRKDIAQKLQTH